MTTQEIQKLTWQDAKKLYDQNDAEMSTPVSVKRHDELYGQNCLLRKLASPITHDMNDAQYDMYIAYQNQKSFREMEAAEEAERAKLPFLVRNRSSLTIGAIILAELGAGYYAGKHDNKYVKYGTVFAPSAALFYSLRKQDVVGPLPAIPVFLAY